MSWYCPTCGRKYPDSELEIDGKGCEVCVVSRDELRPLVKDWRRKADTTDFGHRENVYREVSNDVAEVLDEGGNADTDT